MTLDWLDRIYEVAEQSVGQRSGIELVTVSDPAGSDFAHRVKLLQHNHDDQAGLSIWDDLVDIAVACRWRAATQAAPAATGPDAGIALAIHSLRSEARRIRPALSDETARALDQLLASAGRLGSSDSPVAQTILDTLRESGGQATCVVSTRGWLADLADGWLSTVGVPAACVTSAQLLSGPVWDQAVFVGPPALFGREVFTAPRAYLMTFVQPAWLAGMPLPTSILSRVAERPYVPAVRQFRSMNSAGEPPTVQVTEAELAVKPRWPGTDPGSHPKQGLPAVVPCRRILLSGGYRVMLDVNGSRIRTLEVEAGREPHVVMLDAASVGPGTVLVLKKDASETGALHRMALDALGSEGARIEAGQSDWKVALEDRIERHGIDRVRSELRRQGLAHDRRIAAWASPDLIRPSSDRDFHLLLNALGLGERAEELVANANTLRREHMRAAARLTAELESRLEGSDLTRLQRDGHVEITLDLPGLSSMTATTILAVNPDQEMVATRDVRAMRRDRSARWLE